MLKFLTLALFIMEILVKHIKRETDFFKNFNLVVTSPVTTIPLQTKLKMIAASNLKKKLSASNISESNFHPSNLNLDYNGFDFRYAYQRTNLKIKNPHSDHCYPEIGSLPESLGAHFGFLTSGQAALAVGLFCLKELFKKDPIRFQTSMIYYESFDFLNKFGFKILSNGRTYLKDKIYFIDSSTLQLNEKVAVPDKLSVVVIDTTCWSLTNNKINSLTQKFLKTGACVLLVRSHMKIDCLGVEFNRLGSLLFIAPANKKNLSEKFKSLYQDYASSLGSISEITKVYPFLRSKNFLKLNDQWIKRVQKAHHLFEKDLKLSDGIKLRRYDHQLFCWITFKKNTVNITQLHSTLISRLNAAGLPSLFIASFPWDFIAISFFGLSAQQAKKDQGLDVLRISLGSLEPSEVSIFKKIFLEVIKNEV